MPTKRNIDKQMWFSQVMKYYSIVKMNTFQLYVIILELILKQNIQKKQIVEDCIYYHAMFTKLKIKQKN